MKTDVQITRKLRGAWRLAEVRPAIEEAIASNSVKKLTQTAKEVGSLGFASIESDLLLKAESLGLKPSGKCERSPRCLLSQGEVYYYCAHCKEETYAARRHKSKQKKQTTKFTSTYPPYLYDGKIDPILGWVWDGPWVSNNTGGLVLKRDWRHLQGKLSDANKLKSWQWSMINRPLTEEKVKTYKAIVAKEKAEAESDNLLIKEENERRAGLAYAFLFKLLDFEKRNT